MPFACKILDSRIRPPQQNPTTTAECSILLSGQSPPRLLPVKRWQNPTFCTRQAVCLVYGKTDNTKFFFFSPPTANGRRRNFFQIFLPPSFLSSLLIFYSTPLLFTLPPNLFFFCVRQRNCPTGIVCRYRTLFKRKRSPLHLVLITAALRL